MIFKFSRVATWTLIIGTLGIWGCTNTKAPNDMLAQTETEIERARKLGAQEHAPVELLDAEGKLAKAKTAIEQEENQQAEIILAEAMVDAEHAAIKSRSIKAKSAASTVDDDIEALRNETAESEEVPAEDSGMH
jgi:predicted Fe-Mo cluster-binding NifX family protein